MLLFIPTYLVLIMDGKLVLLLERQAGRELRLKLHTLIPEEAEVLAYLTMGTEDPIPGRLAAVSPGCG